MASIRAGIFGRIIRRRHLFGEDGADIQTLRARLERSAPRVPPWSGVRVDPISDGGVSGEWLVPRDAPADRVLLYVHGGG